MGLEKIGIEPDKRGLLKVNEHYQTAVPHIYAAGDLIGFPALASTSMEQGRVAMCHAFDLKYKTDLARIGLTALLLRQSVSIFIETCFNYPTLSEMYKYAAYDALGRKQRGEIIQTAA